MMHLDSAISIVVALFGTVTVLAAAVAIARASYAKTQIDALRGDRDDLRVRVDYLETENDRKASQLKTEQQKVRVLERIVTGKEQLDRIQTIIENNHQADLLWQEKQEGRAVDILKILKSQRSSDKGEAP